MSIQPLWLTHFIEILLVLEFQITKFIVGVFSYKAHFRPQISSNDSFSIFEKYLKKSKNKVKKPKSRTGKDVIFGSSRVMLPSNKALYITYVGWVNSLTLGVVLISLSLSPLIG